MLRASYLTLEKENHYRIGKKGHFRDKKGENENKFQFQHFPILKTLCVCKRTSMSFFEKKDSCVKLYFGEKRLSSFQWVKLV